MCPAEVLKVRAQVNDSELIRYRQALGKIARTEGVSGLYKGFWPQFWRDVICWGVYFYVYDWVQTGLGVKQAQGDKQYSSQNMSLKMVSGGLAGSISWLVVYPLDIIKTQVQSLDDGRRVTSGDIIRSLYRRAGLAGFFVGTTPTLLRTCCTNSIRLPLFDFLNHRFCKNEKRSD